MRHNCKGAAPIGMDNVVVSYDTPLHLYHMFSIIQMMKKFMLAQKRNNMYYFVGTVTSFQVQP